MDNEHSEVLFLLTKLIVIISSDYLIKLKLHMHHNDLEQSSKAERRLTLHDLLMASPDTPPRLTQVPRPTSTPPKQGNSLNQF